MEAIKVVLCGVGAVGELTARFLLKRKGVKIVGAIDVAEDKVGKDLGVLLGLKKKMGIIVSNVDSVLSNVEVDVVIHATTSYLREAYPQIASIVKHHVNVISTCEELSCPYYSEPKLAEKLDVLAKKHGVTVLGTGVNPGFLMDTLVINLTAVCQKIEKIEAVRVVDAATRRLSFQKKIGAGLTVDEFKNKIACNQITGHVGLENSIAMIADALSWKLEGIKADEVQPVIAKEPVKNSVIKVETGKVVGLRQKARGFMEGREVILLDFQAYMGAKEEYDAITIQGIPPIKQKIQPCIHGDIGTVAILVNSIPKVLKAPAGLLTMKDMPVPSAALEDLRTHISANKITSRASS